MIEIIEPEDIKHLFSRVEEINERTKKHTKETQESRRMIKSFNITG